MPRALSPTEAAQVQAKKKPARPTVYDPSTFSSSVISQEFESWLIVAPADAKQTAVGWINELQKAEADNDYKDLLAQTVDTEIATLEQQLTDLEPKTKAFDTWRAQAGVQGFEDVSEISWLVDELQAGSAPFREQERLKHAQALLRNSNDRLQLAALIKSAEPTAGSTSPSTPPAKQYDGTLPPAQPDPTTQPVDVDPVFPDPPTPPTGTGNAINLQWPIQPPPAYVRRNSFTALYPSGKQHYAQDMGSGGETVVATAAGTVTLARDTKDARGIAVVLDLGQGWEVRHYHLASVSVAKGARVTQGQPIGIVGATGLPKKNPHLHFEVRRNSKPVDSMTMLDDPKRARAVAAAMPRPPTSVPAKSAVPPGSLADRMAKGATSASATKSIQDLVKAGASAATPSTTALPVGSDGTADRKTRLSTWSSVLSGYG